MPKQLLRRTNVVARLQHMRGKGMAQGMNGNRFANPRSFNAFLERALKPFFMHVMATFKSAERIN